jgi:hypothetical protein
MLELDHFGVTQRCLTTSVNIGKTTTHLKKIKNRKEKGKISSRVTYTNPLIKNHELPTPCIQRGKQRKEKSQLQVPLLLHASRVASRYN